MQVDHRKGCLGHDLTQSPSEAQRAQPARAAVVERDDLDAGRGLKDIALGFRNDGHHGAVAEVRALHGEQVAKIGADSAFDVLGRVHDAAWRERRHAAALGRRSEQLLELQRRPAPTELASPRQASLAATRSEARRT